jgi:hypothetical protein
MPACPSKAEIRFKYKMKNLKSFSVIPRPVFNALSNAALGFPVINAENGG